jgi:hypothetical protein
MPGLGTQINFKPSKNLTLNWSTYTGSEYPDDLRRMRYFSNLYGIFKFSEKVSLITGFDYGMEQVYFNRTDYHEWFSPIMIAQYAFSNKWKTAVRIEYYNDEAGIIIPTGTINGFQTLGGSLNIDYYPFENISLRVEGRYLSSEDRVFELQDNNTYTNTNFVVAASIAIKFSGKLLK